MGLDRQSRFPATPGAGLSRFASGTCRASPDWTDECVCPYVVRLDSSVVLFIALAIFANHVMVPLSPHPGGGRVDAMPTRNVNLTRELDRFVATKVKSGRYENASEVVRAGLRTLEREERQYEARLAALRAAIDEGDASGVAEANVFGRVRKALKLPSSR